MFMAERNEQDRTEPTEMHGMDSKSAETVHVSGQPARSPASTGMGTCAATYRDGGT